MSDLSAYELQRLENIKNNEAQLKVLGLDTASGLVNARRTTTAQPIKRRKPDPKPPAEPERKSSRLVGAKAPDFYITSESAKGEITVGGDEKALAEARKAAAKAAATAADPLTKFGLGGMPENEEELLAGEKAAFTALYEAKREKAKELQIEGYKIAQHRSLAEMVRALPTDLESLRICWGWGGSGVRLDKYGELFLGVLAPHVKSVRACHDEARAECEAREAAKPAAADEEDDSHDGDAEAAITAQAAAAKARETQRLRHEARGSREDAMPEKPSDLLAAEKPAFDALVAASHARAEEIGERYVWNIALMRSLCEMVRRVPTSDVELRMCWGFGGKGLRAERHGACLLEALAPHVDSLRDVHGGGMSPRRETEAGGGDDDDEENVPLVLRTKRAKMSVKESVKEEEAQRGGATDDGAVTASRARRLKSSPKADVDTAAPSGRTTRATTANVVGKRKSRI